MGTLRKNGETTETQMTQSYKQPYKVIDQRHMNIGSHTTDTEQAHISQDQRYKTDKPLSRSNLGSKEDMFGDKPETDFDVSFTHEELDGLDGKELKELYDCRVMDERTRHAKENFSDLVSGREQI